MPEIVQDSLIRVENEQETKEGLAYSKELCKVNLKHLCTDVIKYKDWDVCHDELEKFIYEVEEEHEETKNKTVVLILLPRGHLKSSFVTVGNSIRAILKDHNTTILISNAILSNATSFLSEIKEYLTTKSLLSNDDMYGVFRTEDNSRSEAVCLKFMYPIMSFSISDIISTGL